MGGDVEIPWRINKSGRGTLTDIELLEWVQSSGPSSPRQISEMRRRESQIRLQCRYLSEGGLLKALGEDLYQISQAGEEVLTGERSFSVSQGYLNLSQTISFPSIQITDLSTLPQIEIKRQNSLFFEKTNDPDIDTDHGYAVNARDPRKKRNQVWGAKKGKLERLLEEFPTIEGIVPQCAHWMRSIVGLHMFPDANHRTGMTTLFRLILSNDIIDHIDVGDLWPGSDEDIGKAVLLSKYHRYLCSEVNLRTLWRRDSLYWHWHQYFSYLFYDVNYPALNKHAEDKLQRKLKKLRKETE